MASSEDLEDLETYRVQLEQVEAALQGDPENEELKKLKSDLDEIIAITAEIVTPTPSEAKAATESGAPGPSTAKPAGPVKEWKVGDKCMAVWSKNGKHHDAVIDGISDGKAAVTFTGYGTKEINKLSELKLPGKTEDKKSAIWETGNKSRKAEWAAERERRRKRSLKKAQRLKDIEERKEKEKKGWKDFNHKAANKKFKGLKKTSIFASTEETGGRVGVGTCGISGKGMTNLSSSERMNRFNPHPF